MVRHQPKHPRRKEQPEVTEVRDVDVVLVLREHARDELSVPPITERKPILSAAAADERRRTSRAESGRSSLQTVEGIQYELYVPWCGVPRVTQRSTRRAPRTGKQGACRRGRFGTNAATRLTDRYVGRSEGDARARGCGSFGEPNARLGAS